MNTRLHVPMWCEADGLRIWRCPESDFYRDEIGHAAAVYTDQVFEEIAAAGFNAVWLRGKLLDLMASSILPELNDAAAPARLESLREVIARGRRHGVGVYLYFNEPIAPKADHPVWNSHPDIAGQPYHDHTEKSVMVSLCTSTLTVQRFMAEAVGQVLASAAGLAGVILITASESHTHCWSHQAIFSLNDGIHHPSTKPLDCPRCRQRSPADIVAELITIWRDAVPARRDSPQPRVLVWNWSWSIWYPDPQREIIARLQSGVELLVDWERGGTTTWQNKPLQIDEYSLGYIGPSERFLGAECAADEASLPVHAKLQIGTTHEIATVPNLPLIANLHAKFVRLKEQAVAGVMATWNFGCSLTLNSFALGLFCADPVRRSDYAIFTVDLARQYFGDVDVGKLRAAWDYFARAFEHYPFSIHFLYSSPLNYAPGIALTSHYRGQPLEQSWLVHDDYGDRFEDCLGDFTLEQISDSFAAMTRLWDQGLTEYRAALAGDARGCNRSHCDQELSTAAMIGSQLRSFLNLAKFHRWRLEKLAECGLKPPCDVPLDQMARDIIAAECDNARVALGLTQADPRLGWHQECHAYLYSAGAIRAKIQQMQRHLTPQCATAK